MTKRTSILNYESIEKHYDYINSDTKLRKAFELIQEIEEGNVFVFKESIEKLQNTTISTYPDLIKDFLKDASKSSKIILSAIQLISSNEIVSYMVKDTPMLAGHEISISKEEELIFSQTVQKEYKTYMDYYNRMIFDPLFEIYNEIKNQRDLTSSEKGVYGLVSKFNKRVEDQKLEDLTYLLAKIDSLKSLAKNLKRTNEDKALKVYEIIHLLKENSGHVFKDVSFSMNLYNEKILKKEAMAIPLKKEGVTFLFATSSGFKPSRRFVISFDKKLDDSMEFYLTAHIIEHTTKEKLLNIMCAFKDFLFRDKFILEKKVNKDNYKKTHPMIIECEAYSTFLDSINKLKDNYKNIVDDIEPYKNKSMKNKEWLSKLNDYKLFKGSNMDLEAFTEREEFKTHLNAAYENMGVRIFNKDTSSSFQAVIEEMNYVYKNIKNILDCVYTDENSARENCLFVRKPTFHDTLKQSLVIDLCKKENTLNDNAQEFMKHNKEFIELIKALSESKLHNYIEIDMEAIAGDAKNKLEEITRLLEDTALSSFNVKHKSRLKLRKLGNYNALGIYFSHTKTIGIDYRKGRNSYIHEMGHHVDLNNTFKNRDYYISVLTIYFKQRITKRADYYMKPEELIARAAEVSLILHSTNLEFLNNDSIDIEEKLKKIRLNFENSSYCKYMDTWEEYESDEYLSIRELITSRKDLLKLTQKYFINFWFCSRERYEDEIDTQVINNYGVEQKLKKYSPSHYSYSYYHRRSYKIEYAEVNTKEYLSALLEI